MERSTPAVALLARSVPPAPENEAIRRSHEHNAIAALGLAQACLCPNVNSTDHKSLCDRP